MKNLFVCFSLFLNITTTSTTKNNKCSHVCNVSNSLKSVSFSSNLPAPLQIRHLQQTMHGAASNSNGDATSNSIPNPANIPITCARCHTTDARECPSLFLQGPLS